MAKKRLTTPPVPIRIDAATRANIDAIIESGIAKDTSAALRVGAAALARGLVADPRVWEVTTHSWRLAFATEASGRAWLVAKGATEIDKGEWITHDSDGDIDTYYDLEPLALL